MSELVRVVNSVEQKTAEHWNLANKVYNACPKDLLEDVNVGEDCYVATPAVTPVNENGSLKSDRYSLPPHYKELSKAEQAIYEQSFRLARRKANWGKKQGAIYLIVNDNFRDPTLNFDDRIGLMTIMDADTVSDTETFIPTILSELQKSIDRTKKDTEEEKRHTAHVRIGLFIGASVVIAAGYGGYRIYDNIRYGDERAEAAADAHRAEFDQRGISLDVPALEQSTISYVASDPDFFEANQDLPKPDSKDTFENPRQLVIGSSDCETLPVLVDSTDQVRVITNALADVINVDYKSDGQVRICNSTKSTTDSKGNYVSTLDARVAVEVTKS